MGAKKYGPNVLEPTSSNIITTAPRANTAISKTYLLIFIFCV